MSAYEKTCLIRGDGGRSIRGVLNRIGYKWSVLLIATLDGERMRFGTLLQRIPGISQRMLTLTLKRLEADGIVKRTLFPSVPPRVDYELTQLGQTLRGALVPLHQWAAKNKGTIASNRIHASGLTAPQSPATRGRARG